jgi:glycerol-3-phosphate dehydrogenase subunit B
LSGAALEADVLVVGGGLAGAVAALSARAAGARVALVSRGPGATALSSGALSVADDPLSLPGTPFRSRAGVAESARRLAALRPGHPYQVVGPGLDRLREALDFTAGELAPLLAPATGRNRWLLGPYGAARPCALCPRSMEAADLASAGGKLAVVALRGHLGHDAGLVAAGAARAAALGAPAAEVVRLDLFMWEEASLGRPHDLARHLEAPGAAEEAGRMLRRALPAGAAVAVFPPVLGLAPSARVPERIAAEAGLPVAEHLSDLPSLPGLRLQQAIEARLAAAGVEILRGPLAEARGPGQPARAGSREVRAASWVLATGRFVGGGIARRGELAETLLGLPVLAAEGPLSDDGAGLAGRPSASLTSRDSRGPQPLLAAGVRVDSGLRPLDEEGRPVHERLFAAGAVVGGHDHASDGTGLGVALLTGYLAGRAAAGRDL